LRRVVRVGANLLFPLYSKRKLIARLPRNPNLTQALPSNSQTNASHIPAMFPKLLVAAIITSSPLFYAIYIHRKLSSKINHTTRVGTLTTSVTEAVDSIPSDVINNPSHYNIIYDVASKSVPKARLLAFDDSQTLLTTYLRYNMSRFARLPQALLLRLVASSSRNRNSFDPQHLRNLHFEKGDVVCGIYRVEIRTATKVEFSISPPEREPQSSMSGRLVINIQTRDGQSVFSSETVMWKGKVEAGSLPLERTVLKWMHEITAWWLLDSGTEWMVELASRSRKIGVDGDI
jgi:hypothetical protein